MWGDRTLGTREGGCMYSEWGRGVCEEIGALGTRVEGGEGERRFKDDRNTQ